MDRTPDAARDSDPTLTTFDDLVPGDAESGIYGNSCTQPHETECLVQRALLSLPHIQFSSLEVHRLKDGVCLSGVVKIPENVSKPHFERVAGAAAGVSQVLNRLVIQKGS